MTCLTTKPVHTTTNLLPHQLPAVAKMLPTRVGGLFMDMGTGKTRTAIELVRLRQTKISRVIWFCPVSLKQTIRHEILKQTDCQDNDIHVFTDTTNTRTVPHCLWTIIGIESVSASNRVTLTANSLMDDNTFVIVDESSYIKGHRSQRTQRITNMAARCRYRLILTGTPISQGIVDLYAQMRFLSPKILGYQSFYSFARNHLEYSEKFKGLIVRSHNLEYVAAKIQPYVYQVTKDECLSLPPKLYDSHYVSLTDEQTRYYKQAKDEMLVEIDYEDFKPYTLFKLFNALQQISCGFWNQHWLNANGKKCSQLLEIPHDRINTLLSVIAGLPESEKIIIWAKHRYDIQQIAAALIAEYGEHCAAVYYGDYNETKRHQELTRFRSSARFFIATPSCGGHGLTLNEARYAIFYSNSFKYADRIQAEDRCHRIGQQHTVTYIDLWAICGIDERIDLAISKKADAVKQFRLEVDKIKQTDKQGFKDLVERL